MDFLSRQENQFYDYLSLKMKQIIIVNSMIT